MLTGNGLHFILPIIFHIKYVVGIDGTQLSYYSLCFKGVT